MEYALRAKMNLVNHTPLKCVLILILMEYALRDNDDAIDLCDYKVLILILMEYALRVKCTSPEILSRKCLNPYSNGICSTSYDGQLCF